MRDQLAKIRSEALAAFENAADLAALEAKLVNEALDVTIPGTPVTVGHKHPMYIALD